MCANSAHLGRSARKPPIRTVKTFFEFSLSNVWVTRNPARLERNPRGRDTGDRRGEQKLPFSDEELRSMYEACETKYGKQEKRSGFWT
jgi:hypothetical protein